MNVMAPTHAPRQIKLGGSVRGERYIDRVRSVLTVKKNDNLEKR